MTVDQPTAAPTRKVLFSMFAALALVLVNTALPAMFPLLDTHPAIGPLWQTVKDFAPMIVAATGYMTAERA